MIVKKRNEMYSSNRKIKFGSGLRDRKLVRGSGFIDSLTSALGGIGSFIKANKDAFLKPVLGAVGSMGAMALTEGGKAIMKKISKNKNNKVSKEALQILETITKNDNTPVSNILGEGIKRF